MEINFNPGVTPVFLFFIRNKINYMKISTFILTALMLFDVTAGFSQAGTLDSSFSKDGKVKSTLLVGGSSIAIQPDGKILVASASGFSVIRFKSNGTIDKSFGLNGVASTSFEGVNDCYLLALQSDGKIILAGYSIDNIDIFWISLARFTTSGLPDSSFGINGQVKTDANYYLPTDIAIAADGKILLSSTDPGYVTFTPDISIWEYNNDGSVQDVFSYNSGEPGTRDISNALAIQSTGKIVVAGALYNNDSIGSSFGMLRFRANGSLDNRFGTNSGKTILPYGEGKAMTLQSNDKIIVLGDSIIFRFTKNGVPDSSFGTYGMIYPAFRGNSVEVQADGKIIIAGRLFNGTDYDFAIARYTAKGKPDKTFGANGIVTTDFGENDNATSIALQTDGKIAVAGSSVPESQSVRCVVARYKGDASLHAKENVADIVAKHTLENSSAVIKMFPNPVQSILYVKLNAGGTVKRQINVYDINGKLVLTKSTNDNAQLDMKQLNAGVYLIKINDENAKELYSGKVVKQ